MGLTTLNAWLYVKAVTLLIQLICGVHQNPGLDEAQAGIKIAKSNINSLRYAHDTTLTAESKDELKDILMEVKEESKKAGLKLSIQKTKIMASHPIISWQIDGENNGNNDIFYFHIKISGYDDCSHEIQRHLLLRRKTMTNLDIILKSRDNSLLARFV